MWPGGTSKVGRSPGPACTGVCRGHRRPGAGNQLQILGCARGGRPEPPLEQRVVHAGLPPAAVQGSPPPHPRRPPQASPPWHPPAHPTSRERSPGAVCRLQGQGPRPLLAGPRSEQARGPRWPWLLLCRRAGHCGGTLLLGRGQTFPLAASWASPSVCEGALCNGLGAGKTQPSIFTLTS